MRGGSASLAAGLVPAVSETEIPFDDLAALLVVGIQPAADGLARKAAISEHTDERPPGAHHAGDISEHFYRPGQVVDGHTADDGVEGLIGEWQPGLCVEVVDDGDRGQGVRV